MNTVSLRLPTTLHEELREFVQEGFYFNPFVMLAVAEKVAPLNTQRSERSVIVVRRLY